MKYAVIEAVNTSLLDHPSGISTNDGDDDQLVWISCVGKPYESKKEAKKALEDYLAKIIELIEGGNVLNPGWEVGYDCDSYEICVEKVERVYDDEGYSDVVDISDHEWVVKCDVVELPENDQEIKHYQCFYDFASEWWDF